MFNDFFALFHKSLPNPIARATRLFIAFSMAPVLVVWPDNIEQHGLFWGTLATPYMSMMLLPWTVSLGSLPYMILRKAGWLRLHHFAIAGAVTTVLSALGALTLMVKFAPLRLPNPTLQKLIQSPDQLTLNTWITPMLSVVGAGAAAALTIWLLLHSTLAETLIAWGRGKSST